MGLGGLIGLTGPGWTTGMGEIITGSGRIGSTPGSGRITGMIGRVPGSGKTTGIMGRVPGSGRTMGIMGRIPGSGKTTSGTAGAGRTAASGIETMVAPMEMGLVSDFSGLDTDTATKATNAMKNFIFSCEKNYN